LNFGSELFQCTEALFNPSLLPSSTSAASPTTKQATAENKSYKSATTTSTITSTVPYEYLNTSNGNGIHTLLYHAINESDAYHRKELLSHIVLSGGNTMFTGFNTRLERELKSYLLSSTNEPTTSRTATPSLTSFAKDVKIVTSPATAVAERWHDVWLGASIFATTSSFVGIYITKQEYDENGPQIVHRKCY
jgi:actin-related protein